MYLITKIEIKIIFDNLLYYIKMTELKKNLIINF